MEVIVYLPYMYKARPARPRAFSSPSRFLLSANFQQLLRSIIAAMSSSNSDEGHGSHFYSAATAPHKAREGLVTRRAAVGNISGEIQLNIDDLEQGAFNHGVAGLRSQVSHETKVESKYHTDMVKRLQVTSVKAQVAVKNNARRLNQRIVRVGSDHVKHVILFALVCFIVIYLWSKFSGR